LEIVGKGGGESTPDIEGDWPHGPLRRRGIPFFGERESQKGSYFYALSTGRVSLGCTFVGPGETFYGHRTRGVSSQRGAML